MMMMMLLPIAQSFLKRSVQSREGVRIAETVTIDKDSNLISYLSSVQLGLVLCKSFSLSGFFHQN